jgi:hypothetical protein
MAEEKKPKAETKRPSGEDASSREASQNWPSREEIERFKIPESRNGMPGYGQPDTGR